jgi:glycosyltransferase involved in cell wall biosynthesis/SAM-dependent methyltransferase
MIDEIKYPKLSFCTPCHNDGASVGIMIQSIIDQDYPNIEQILVDDGSKDNSWVVLQEMARKYPDRVKVFHFEENKGACEARNEAARHATGKYISFLPADAKLYPGVARIWVETLEKRPDYDFLYGGYTFVDDSWNKVMDYISEPFDPYILDGYNYIDGSYPLKKSLYDKMGGWDSRVKSLQDWDFWLNAVKNHNAKGFYKAELFFETIMPHPGGLSDDSSRNWLERTDYIKQKYNIPERDICVCSFGAPFHGKNTAKLLGADYKEMPSFKPHRYKMIYIVGGYYSNFPNIVKALQFHDGLRVIHWIGSDILQLKQLKENPDPMARIALGEFLKFIANNIDVNLCEFEQTKKELKEFEINARIIPLPCKELYELMPLPEKFTVAAYLPFTNQNFYFPDLIRGLPEKIKDVNFIFFGDQTMIGGKENMKFMGQVEHEKMIDIIKESSCILRLTPHDGLPLSVCEFILAGRNAITTVNMPYVFVPKDIKEEYIIEAINTVKNVKQNIEGSKYYRKYLDHDNFKKEVLKLLEYEPKKYWENRARSWDIIKGETLIDVGDKIKADEYTKFIDKVLEKFPNKGRVLDVGCGNGNWSDWWFQKGFKYLGVDISKKLIEIARNKHIERSFVQSDLLELSETLRNWLKEEKLDLAFTYTTLLHVKPENMEKAVNELKKVAKFGLFIEPIKKMDKNMVTSRQLHPELLRDIIKKGLILQGIESSFVHNYAKYFKIIDFIEIDNRGLFFVDLQ